jgi:hypothetical protein
VKKPGAAQGDMKPETKGSDQGQVKPETKGSAEGEIKKPGAAQGDMKPETKGSAQGQVKPETKGSAEGEMKSDTTKGSAQGEMKGDTQGSAASDTKGGEMKSGRAAAAKELSTEQRTTFREKLVTKNVDRVNVDFNVSIGAVVPRTIRGRPLPVEIVEVVPEYRGYDYIVLADGRIVIIDPATYEVVTILSV